MTTWVLSLVDALSLLAFVVVGLGTHHVLLTTPTLLRDAAPLLGAWFLFALVSRVYQRPGRRRLLVNWALAIPVGVLVRQYWVGRMMTRGTISFLVAALGFTFVFLLAGRGVAALILRRGWRHKSLRDQ